MSRVRIATIVLVAIVAAAVVFSVGASDETLIRRQLASVEKHFNAQRSGAMSRLLTERFNYASYPEMTREDVRGYLAREFFRDGLGARYRYRLEIMGHSAEITVADPPETARVTAELRFEEFEGENWKPIEPMEVTMKFQKVDGQWRIRQVEQLPRTGPIRY